MTRATLLAVRELINGVLAGATEPPQSRPQRRTGEYVKIVDFARDYGYAPRTVAAWIKLGMPHVGKGRATRIHVAKAQEWLNAGGPQRARRELRERRSALQ